jgi:hypothetical protein
MNRTERSHQTLGGGGGERHTEVTACHCPHAPTEGAMLRDSQGQVDSPLEGITVVKTSMFSSLQL